MLLCLWFGKYTTPPAQTIFSKYNWANHFKITLNWIFGVSFAWKNSNREKIESGIMPATEPLLLWPWESPGHRRCLWTASIKWIQRLGCARNARIPRGGWSPTWKMKRQFKFVTSQTPKIWETLCRWKNHQSPTNFSAILQCNMLHSWNHFVKYTQPPF